MDRAKLEEVLNELFIVPKKERKIVFWSGCISQPTGMAKRTVQDLNTCSIEQCKPCSQIKEAFKKEIENDSKG